MPEPVTVAGLAGRHEVLLFDAYGVLVHASGAMPGAVELIDTLDRLGRAYFILTNDASKLPATASARYARHGLGIDASRIITSGTLIAGWFRANRLQGARAVVLGPPDSARYVAAAGATVVGPAEDFEVVVLCDETGFDFLPAVDAVLSGIFRRIGRGEPVRLLLPNPDLVYPQGEDAYGMAAGAVALMFEAAIALRHPGLDLRFERLGKPHAAIWEEALRRTGTRDMVMIGDQLETDIRGANAFGIASALVATGVTTVDPAGLPDTIRPTYRLASLDWD